MNERSKMTDECLYDRVFSFHWSLRMFQTADQACSGLALARTGGHGGQQGTPCSIFTHRRKIKVCVPPTVAFDGTPLPFSALWKGCHRFAPRSPALHNVQDRALIINELC